MWTQRPGNTPLETDLIPPSLESSERPGVQADTPSQCCFNQLCPSFFNDTHFSIEISQTYVVNITLSEAVSRACSYFCRDTSATTCPQIASNCVLCLSRVAAKWSALSSQLSSKSKSALSFTHVALLQEWVTDSENAVDSHMPWGKSPLVLNEFSLHQPAMHNEDEKQSAQYAQSNSARATNNQDANCQNLLLLPLHESASVRRTHTVVWHAPRKHIPVFERPLQNMPKTLSSSRTCTQLSSSLYNELVVPPFLRRKEATQGNRKRHTCPNFQTFNCCFPAPSRKALPPREPASRPLHPLSAVPDSTNHGSLTSMTPLSFRPCCTNAAMRECYHHVSHTLDARARPSICAHCDITRVSNEGKRSPSRPSALASAAYAMPMVTIGWPNSETAPQIARAPRRAKTRASSMAYNGHGVANGCGGGHLIVLPDPTSTIRARSADSRRLDQNQARQGPPPHE